MISIPRFAAAKANLLALALIATLPAFVSGQQKRPADVADRIARVERGLMLGSYIAGQPMQRFTIEERLQTYRTPGVSVAVMHDGKIEWAKGYGVVRVGTNQAVDSTTLFQAASISKPVAAVAALRLVEKGRLTLDADINTVLKSWKVPDNSFTATEKVTLRRLVSHTAGLTVHGFPGYDADSTVPTVVQVLDGTRPANTAAVRVNVAPGSIWRYSGGGFTVMQLALSDMTGKPFPELVRELVLAPAGMTSSGYEQPLPEAKRARAAIAHRGNGKVVEGLWHTYPEMAAAGLWTTPTDLLLFARAIQRSLGGEANSLLSQKMARDFVTIQKGSYGLGVSVEGTGATMRFSHGGANEGYRCMFFAFTEHGDGVAIMTNSDNGGQLAGEIARAVSDVYGWAAMPPVAKQAIAIDQAQLKAVAGRYLLTTPSDTIPLTMRFEDGVLFADVPPLGPKPMRLYAAEPNRFFMLETPAEFGIDKDSSGAVVAIRLLNLGQPLRALRQP